MSLTVLEFYEEIDYEGYIHEILFVGDHLIAQQRIKDHAKTQKFDERHCSYRYYINFVNDDGTIGRITRYDVVSGQVIRRGQDEVV